MAVLNENCVENGNKFNKFCSNAIAKVKYKSSDDNIRALIFLLVLQLSFFRKQKMLFYFFDQLRHI